MKKLEAFLAVDSNSTTDTDCKINMNVTGFVPLLKLSDTFINNNIITTEDITLKAVSNYLYINDEDDNNLFKHILTVTSNNGVTNNIYYSIEYKCLVNVYVTDEVFPDDLKNRELNLNITVFTNSNFTDTYENTLKLNSNVIRYDMSEPDNLDDVEIKRLIIDVPGLSTTSNIRKYRENLGRTIDVNANALELIAIKTSDLNFPTNPTLHTLYTPGVFQKTFMYLGPVQSDYIFIPLT